MGRAFDSITATMREFVAEQHVFFVATAPSGDDGHINLSPKGYDSLRIIDDHHVAYLDLTGSGAETVAHVRQNGRITFMFCAFAGKPNIVRFYGQGRVLRPGDSGWDDHLALFDDRAPTDGPVRSIIVAEIDRTSTACGFAVPFMDYVDERPTLLEWAAGKSQADREQYWADNNATSIDGLPAVG